MRKTAKKFRFSRRSERSLKLDASLLVEYKRFMRVLYDLSHLGMGLQTPIGRTGVFRVVERTAVALAGRTDIQLQFSVVSSLSLQARTLDYVASSENLRGVEFPHSNSAKRLIDWAGQFYETPFEDQGWSRYKRSARNRSFLGFQRFMQAIVPPVRKGQLRGTDIFHSPSQPISQEMLRETRASFMTVYDMTPFVVPQYHVDDTRRHLDLALASIRNGAWAICISEATRIDLLQQCPGLDGSRVSVSYLAADERFAPCTDPNRLAEVRAKYGIGAAPFFLCVNTLEPRKNVEAVIRCFAKLVAQEHLTEAQLVLVGPRGWLSNRLDETLREHGGKGSRVIVTGFVADEDLAPLYSAARSFIYISHYEGFGLPPLEAMQCGAPVITSNTSSLPEVVGDAAIQVSPTDDDAICDAMLQIWTSDDTYEDLRRKGLARARLFTWAATAESIVAAYRRAL